MTRRIVLVGLPGVGKSTVGAALAATLGVPFFDVDEVVREQTGETPAALLATVGEGAFRAAEADAVASVLARPGALVVATGGGAVETATTRELLAAERGVVLLFAPASVLVERIGDGGDRPLVAAPTVERLIALGEWRAPWYDEVADVEVEATGSIDEVVARITTLVGVS
ncbi:MAG TPA: shikimate kinase [Acidimicrobiales bacterium]|jgi:shikimate kinase